MVVRAPRATALVLALGTLVIILALAFAQITMGPLNTPHVGNEPRAMLPIAHTSSIMTAASSAYDGLDHQPTHALAPLIASMAPIQRAVSSAYDGQQPEARRSAGLQPRSINPIQVASSSAYDGY